MPLLCPRSKAPRESDADRRKEARVGKAFLSWSRVGGRTSSRRAAGRVAAQRRASRPRVCRRNRIPTIARLAAADKVTSSASGKQPAAGSSADASYRIWYTMNGTNTQVRCCAVPADAFSIMHQCGQQQEVLRCLPSAQAVKIARTEGGSRDVWAPTPVLRHCG